MDGSLVSLSGLLVGNQVFDIPVYQRSYAWGQKNLEDLWEDLYYLDPSKKHYFGTVLLKDSGKTAKTTLSTLKRFDVIDGQQRLTTILILLREIISQLEAISGEQLRAEVEALKRDYLKDGGHFKLNPMGTDGQFFHHVVIDANDFLSEDSDNPSQRRLADAKTFFRKRLFEEQKRQPSKYQDFLVQLKRKIDDLQMIQYQVTSDADAIRIFETVNDRGRPLSNLEKTKSFIMHTSYLGMGDEDAVAGRLEELNGHFSGMYSHFGDVTGTKHLDRLRLTEDDIHRYHFIIYISPGENSSRPLDSLKDRIRDMLREDQSQCVKYALAYAKDLEQAFFAVKRITDAYKKDTNGGTLSKVFMLERMGNVFPLLIASWLKFGGIPGRMEEILRLIEGLVFRLYLVGGRRSDSGGSWLNRIAHGVHRGSLDYYKLIDELKQVILYYQNDGLFRQNLSRQDSYHELDRRTIKYLLSEYEIHLRKKKSDVQLAPSTQEEILTPGYQVEHIWPQNPSAKMSEDEELTHSQNVHRLGNLTIARESWNKSMGNRPFEDKRWQPDDRPSYSNSSLLVQKELADLTVWNDEQIKDREQKIVEFALERWKL